MAKKRKRMVTEDHDHSWSYVHAVYSSDLGATLVRRWCYLCGLEQVGYVRGWREPKKNEFDQTAEEAAEALT